MLDYWLRWFRRYKVSNTRSYLRIPAPWMMKCQPKASQGARRVANLKNVSAGGAAVIFPGMILAGTFVDLEIHVPMLNRSVPAEGQVVRCLPVPGGFDLGIRFTKIDQKDRSELDESVKRFFSPLERLRHEQRSWWRKLP